jgi:hypothetical protein
MTPSEIIIKEAQSQSVDPKQALQHTVALVNSGQAVLLQENNSVLLVLRLGDGKVALYLSTVDSPVSLKSAFSVFLKKLKSSNEIHTAYVDTKNDQIVRLMNKTGWGVKKSNNPKFTFMAKIK